MKIVQINAVYGYGSTGVIVKDIQNACINMGWQCCVVYSQSNQEVHFGYHIGNLLSNKLHAILTRISGKQGYFSFLSTYKLIKYLKAYKPDIVHLHNLHGNYINLPLLLTYLAKKDIKTVVSLHDCWFYTGGCSHYTAVKCSKWEENCGDCPRRYEEFPAILWDSSKKQLEDRIKLFEAIKNLTVVGVSNWITAEAAKNVFRSAKCLTIHNGIDINFFHPIKTDKIRYMYNLKGKFIILAPANKWFQSVNAKTLEYFSNRLTDDMVMVFIGNGANKALLTKKMVDIGFVASRERIREIYCSADVMVNCTREESLSLLNVEVQACGTPVITYANTGVKETVNEKCSFSVENGNPEKLWDVLMKIRERGKHSYSNDCVMWCRERFDREKNYIKYLNLYKAL